MNKYDWDRLNRQQLGKYAEYFTKMEFILYGLEVYTTEVDDRGIDYVIKKDGRYYDIQVKSIRFPVTNYIYMKKKGFQLRENLFLVLVLFRQWQEPELFLIPSKAWEEPNDAFKDHNHYREPEWGLNISNRTLKTLEEYRFDKMINTL